MKNPELEKFLLNALPKDEFREKFKERLKNAEDDYWQIMSEMRTIYIFDKVLKIPIANIEAKTIKEKDVDFTADSEDGKIYVEVKGFRPIDEDIAKRGGWLGSDDEKIARALRRSQNKFLENSYNITVIADENTIRLPIFMNLLTDLEKTPEIYLNNPDYNKTSALMILGGMYYGQQYNYKIWYNDNSQKPLSDNLKNIFNKHKSNFYK